MIKQTIKCWRSRWVWIGVLTLLISWITVWSTSLVAAEIASGQSITTHHHDINNQTNQPDDLLTTNNGWLGLMVASTSPQTNFAERIDCDPSGTNAQRQECGFVARVSDWLNLFGLMVVPIITIFLIIGGIRFAASGGDQKAIEGAKKQISDAVLALVCFGLLWSFLRWLIPGDIPWL